MSLLVSLRLFGVMSLAMSPRMSSEGVFGGRFGVCVWGSLGVMSQVMSLGMTWGYLPMVSWGDLEPLWDVFAGDCGDVFASVLSDVFRGCLSGCLFSCLG